MNEKILVFNLDNVLLNELDYVRSGLRYLATTLAERYCWDVADLERQLLASLNVSRERIVERVLIQKGICSEQLVDWCENQMNQHYPTIRLSNRVKRLIKYLDKQYSIYVVATGHPVVQDIKLDVLGLSKSPFIKSCYVVDNKATNYKNKLQACFRKIIETEPTSDREPVFISTSCDMDIQSLENQGVKIIEITSADSEDKESNISGKDLHAVIQSLTGLDSQ